MLVQGKQKLPTRLAVVHTVLVNPFDRFTKDVFVESICIVVVRGVVFALANIKDKPAQRVYLVKKAVGEVTELSIFCYVPNCVQT